MNASKDCVELLTALCAARLAFPAITRNREGFSKRTGQRYHYADIAAVIDGTATVLAQHGLILVQALEDGEGGTLLVSSTLFHAASGQWLSSELIVEKPQTMQDFGAVATYAKRYSMQSLLNVSGEDDDDAASVSEPSAVQASAPVAPSPNGHTPSPTSESSEHPTEAHIGALRALALQDCGEPEDVLADRIRRTMGLKPGASVSPKLLTRTMSMAQFMAVFEHYTALKAQLARPTKEPNHGAVQASPHAPAPEPAVSAAVEDARAVPSPAASSSVGPDADAETVERDRQRLREEIQAWDLRISPDEIEHVITHNGYSRARTLLWGARRQRPEPALAS